MSKLCVMIFTLVILTTILCSHSAQKNSISSAEDKCLYRRKHYGFPAEKRKPKNNSKLFSVSVPV